MDGIDPLAVVHPGAAIGAGTTVGPFCVIGAKVRIGSNCRIHSHVVIEGSTTIGDRCQIFPFASIGQIPQDLKFRGEDTKLSIGNENVIRESVTINIGTAGGGGETTIGNGNLLMAGVHVAHDCHLGNGIIMANAATLAGHVDVQDGSTVGAFSGVHQFCRIGRESFIGGYSVVTQDALPFHLTVGNRAECHGPNTLGLKRKGYSEETIRAIKRTYMTIFRSKKPREDAITEIEAEFAGIPEVMYLVEFIRTSERGVIG